MRNQKGVSLVEVLLAVAVISVVAVVTTGMLFSGLSWRDRVVAAEQVEESGRIFTRAVRLSVLGAESVTSGGSWLRTVAEGDCWSFRWDSGLEKMKFSHSSVVGCTPDEFPTGDLFATIVDVKAMSFDLELLDTGGRQVKVDTTLSVTRPLGAYERNMSSVMINLIDED